MSRLSTLLLLLGTAACATPGEVPAWGGDSAFQVVVVVEADLGRTRALLGNALRPHGLEPARTTVLRRGRHTRRARVTALGPEAGPLHFELVEKVSPGRPVLTSVSLLGDHEVSASPARPQRAPQAEQILSHAIARAAAATP